MLKRLQVFLVALVLLLITGIVLTIFTMEREQEFRAHSHDIQSAVVESAAYAVNLQLKNKRRLVNLFIEEYAALFRHLEQYPENEQNISNINHRLKQRFQDFFTFTIADSSGNPILTDIESLVGDACQQDLNHFASRLQHKSENYYNQVFIHPQPFHYHYDVMAPLASSDNGNRIFFASFHLDEIADILKTHEIPGQQLFIVRQSEPNLIEVSRRGARDQLKRNPNLTIAEQTRILVFENIPDTDWRIVNLPDRHFESDYIDGLWKELLVLLGILAVAFLVMVSITYNISQKQGNNTGH